MEEIAVKNVIRVRQNNKVAKATIEARYDGFVRYSATFVRKDESGRLTAIDRIRYTEMGVPEERNVHIPKEIFGRMASRAYAIFGNFPSES